MICYFCIEPREQPFFFVVVVLIPFFHLCIASKKNTHTPNAQVENINGTKTQTGKKSTKYSALFRSEHVSVCAYFEKLLVFER